MVNCLGAVSILSLVDLDRPYLQDLNADRFEALKTCLNAAGTLVWVTCGSRDETPYSYMMMGIMRTVTTENPSLSTQMLDLDSTTAWSGGPNDRNTVVDLAQAVLRQRALYSWDVSSTSTNNSTLLWMAEPEIFLKGGRQLIIRLLPDQERLWA